MSRSTDGGQASREQSEENPAHGGKVHARYASVKSFTMGGAGDGVQLLIDVVEQSDDQIPCGHVALLSVEGCHADQHGRGVCLRQAQKCVLIVRKVLYTFMVCQRLIPSV